MAPLAAVAAIVLGFVCILADTRVAGFIPNRPETGAAFSRLLGLILLVGGGLLYLHWAGAA